MTKQVKRGPTEPKLDKSDKARINAQIKAKEALVKVMPAGGAKTGMKTEIKNLKSYRNR